MPSKKNTSRKSTASQGTKPKVVLTETLDFPSIVITHKQKTPSSRNSTQSSKAKSSPPLSPRPEFLEPLSPRMMSPLPTKPIWDQMGMMEADFHAMQERVFKAYEEGMRKNYKSALLADWDDPSYWKGRRDLLERERGRFNQMRAWSSAVIAKAEELDAQIAECEDRLEEIYAEEDRLEAEYD